MVTLFNILIILIKNIFKYKILSDDLLACFNWKCSIVFKIQQHINDKIVSKNYTWTVFINTLVTKLDIPCSIPV